MTKFDETLNNYITESKFVKSTTVTLQPKKVKEMTLTIPSVEIYDSHDTMETEYEKLNYFTPTINLVYLDLDTVSKEVSKALKNYKPKYSHYGLKYTKKYPPPEQIAELLIKADKEK